MKCKRLLLLLLLAIGLPWAANAQSQTCTFGDDATKSYYYYSPYGGYYGWHYRVFLYDADDVNFNGSVTAISFWSAYATEASNVANYTIYMKDEEARAAIEELDPATHASSETCRAIIDELT